MNLPRVGNDLEGGSGVCAHYRDPTMQVFRHSFTETAESANFAAAGVSIACKVAARDRAGAEVRAGLELVIEMHKRLLDDRVGSGSQHESRRRLPLALTRTSTNHQGFKETTSHDTAGKRNCINSHHRR
jgi:hypothetical protein